MYYENFEMLCKKNDVTPSKVSRETGISTATLTSWKKGKYTPKQDKLQIIADFFHVSIDYIMTGKENQFTIEMADMDAELIMMEKRLKEYALKLSRLPKEEIEFIFKMIDKSEV